MKKGVPPLVDTLLLFLMDFYFMSLTHVSVVNSSVSVTG